MRHTEILELRKVIHIPNQKFQDGKDLITL